MPCSRHWAIDSSHNEPAKRDKNTKDNHGRILLDRVFMTRVIQPKDSYSETCATRSNTIGTSASTTLSLAILELVEYCRSVCWGRVLPENTGWLGIVAALSLLRALAQATPPNRTFVYPKCLLHYQHHQESLLRPDIILPDSKYLDKSLHQVLAFNRTLSKQISRSVLDSTLQAEALESLSSWTLPHNSQRRRQLPISTTGYRVWS